jgi:hypothetical protein
MGHSPSASAQHAAFYHGQKTGKWIDSLHEKDMFMRMFILSVRERMQYDTTPALK